MSQPIDPLERENEVVRVTDTYDHYDPADEAARTRVVEDVVEVRRNPAAVISRVIWLMLAFLEAAIGLRIILLLIGANPASPFAAIVYGLTDFFLWPFSGLVSSIQAGTMVLEVSSIIAMLVYALLAWGLTELVWLMFGSGQRRRYVRRDRSDF